MTRLEMVEKLQEKTGVAYEVARDTLEENDWDVLDAVRELDRNAQGTSRESAKAANAPAETASRQKGRSGELGRKVRYVLRWVLSWIAKGEGVRLEIYCRDENVGSISLTALILLFLLKWFIPAALLAAGLFCGYRYRITGSSAAGKLLNSLSNKAGDKAREFKDKMNEE